MTGPTMTDLPTRRVSESEKERCRVCSHVMVPVHNLPVSPRCDLARRR